MKMAATPRSKGKALTSREKAVAFNVYQFNTRQHPGKTVEELIDLTAEATGISKSSIYRLRKEMATNQKFVTPGKTKPNRKGKATRPAEV